MPPSLLPFHMTHRTTLTADAPPSAGEARRAKAFGAARRHSVRVRRLRRTMIIGPALFVAGIVVVTFFNPFARVVGGVTIDGATIDGTKVTMINPKLSGHQKDGRPYQIEAARAVQDVKTPTLFELHDLKARLVMPDRTVTRVTAAVGAYNSTAETMALSGGAHVVGDDGLDVVTADALVEFASNSLTTTKPVAVAMPGRRIAADAMRIIDGGARVTFEGHVHTDLTPDDRLAAAEPELRP